MFAPWRFTFFAPAERQPDVFGFTADETGSNLPTEFAPWEYSDDAGALTTGVGASEPLKTAIDRDGYYIASSETLSRNTGIPWVD